LCSPSQISLQMSTEQVQVNRILVSADFGSGCCEGAPFLPEAVIAKTPEVLRSIISDEEWSSSMRQLQQVTLNEIPSTCSKITLCWCFGLCSLICLSSCYSTASRRFAEALRDVNTRVFEPKGLFMALQKPDVDCCTSSNILVIALNPAESKILKTETHYL